MTERNYDRIGMHIVHARLENGLNIYIDRRPGFGKKFAYFATHYGGNDVNFAKDGIKCNTPAGVAHFLEHKLFDTEAGDATTQLSENGVSPNAYTSAELTAYFFECTEKFEENFKILLEFVSIPYFTKESVDKEQGIIAQEISMCDDDPDQQVYYAIMKALYQHHPVKDHVIGTAESIAEITAQTLYDCHAAFYHPGNMALCVAGDVDPEAVIALARAVLPTNEREAPVRDYGAPESDSPAVPVVEVTMDVPVPLFFVGFKTDAPTGGQAQLRTRLLAELTCEVLCGKSSPLYAKLYEDGLINRTFQYGYESVPGAAVLLFGGESRNPAAVRDALLAESARIAADGIDPVLWSRLKKADYGQLVRGLNSFDNTCLELARGHFSGTDYLRFPEAYDTMEKTDAEDLLRRRVNQAHCALGVVRAKEEDQ